MCYTVVMTFARTELTKTVFLAYTTEDGLRVQAGTGTVDLSKEKLGE